MREGVRNFLVGITSIVALVGLAVLLMLFGELDALVHPRYALNINTDHAMGLRPGSSVELNGVPIGVIDVIEVGDDPQFPVMMSALINDNVRIPTRATPYAATSLLGGASILEIEATGEDEAVDFFPTDGTATIQAPLKIRMIEQITSELDARMKPLTESMERFNELAATYTEVGRNINEMVAMQREEDLAAGETPNLRTVVQKLYDVLDSTEEALALARDWLGDEQLRADAKAAVEKASTLIDQASETLDRFTELAGNLEADADELVKHIMPVADELSATLAEVRRLTTLATEGQGSVALMLNNPDLYHSLDDAAKRLEAALREIQLFMQKAKSEGLPINY
jgi:phospholipid/cholesterol/gamma-HCH transport system substrate-binding protein